MKIHFVGIGGIGVSALARYHLARGDRVSGSDLNPSKITRDLKRDGARIFTGHKAENLDEGTDLVVHSVAVDQSNPELQKARRMGSRIQTYPQALGELTKKYWTIAVCGAHGKGTTTALLSLILMEAGLDPTVIIGTNLSQFGNTNCRVGESGYLVIEADEYRRAFLNYWPEAIVLTNIDKEHLDCFKDLEEIKKTFAEFISHLPEKGVLVANEGDKNVVQVLNTIKGQGLRIERYSLNQTKETEDLEKSLSIPGRHNLSNGLAALTLARTMEIPDPVSLKAMKRYEGGWRRFEIVQKKPFVLISDYAHHPTEIEATLEGARERYPEARIWAVFQPHQYQRTYYLRRRFEKAFEKADRVVITEIYSVAGREKEEIKKKISGGELARSIEKKDKKVHFLKEYTEIPEFLKGRVGSGDVVLVMGAGNIYKIVENLIE